MLRRSFITAALAATLLFSATAKADNPRVLIETNLGSMIIELYPNEAPLTVANFLEYVNSGFYDGTIFHRVIGNFMIQGGGIDEQMRRKPTRDPIQNEADNGLQNRIGTIAMARTNDPHSATSQFFINVANNSSLDFREKTPRAWGYTVFGRVVDGMRTVNQIRTQPTTSRNGYQDVPINPVVIERIRQIQ
ncbi:peptidylprolyl isomerase [Thiomicrospira aerophila AL3]|uniref:Peptidyl-prolyl cis-trans isomerase n=1 Tax=Thiomicrospira aerophila AL3 TaxID=717772 RepID=W0DWU9_9GAMM|nr:peptidylprolyl isomerase [Thiomicrospira aerophila]AHF01341.1 peptidylprolyl isomerase [Thiomicrospira aerophila AL3]